MMNDQNNRWPNFLIVGTARAGTTSIHEYLGKHPDIFMPLQKEPCFFTFYNKDPQFKDTRHRYTSTIEEYQGLFNGSTKKIAGESSTPYLYFHDQTIENIKNLVPEHEQMKILIILRDPAERAYSQYMHNRRDLREELSFEEAIEQEKDRKIENRHFDYFYVNKGFYYAQVKAYRDNFKNVKIVFYDSLEKNPDKLLADIFEYLEVEPLKENEMVHRNQSGEMKVKWFKQIITTRKNPVMNFFRKLMSRETKKKLRNYIKDKLLRYNLKKTEMNKDTRRKLIEIYREDILQLQKIVDRDLSDWLRV